MSKGEKNTRYFKTEEILDALVAECKDHYRKAGDRQPSENDIMDWVGESILCCSEFVGTAKFENLNEMVFPDCDGTNWAVHFETNAGAGYDDFFGIGSAKRPWEVECQGFTCFEVHKVTRTTEVWEPVLLEE